MEELIENFKKAQSIAERVFEFSKKNVKVGMKILDLAEKIEKKIFELGAKPAWPVNICINNIAAHYTPSSNDETVLKENDYVKIDFGVQVNGYISDNAFTVCLGKKDDKLIKASEEALNESLKSVKEGVKVKEISEIIASVLEKFEVKTIRNLTGHALERYKQHAWPPIPNVRNGLEVRLEKNQLIAIEVFTTTGPGWVKESAPTEIFQFNQRKQVRWKDGRKILDLAEKKFEKLPFAKRWIKEIPPISLDLGLKELVEVEALTEFPPLKEDYGVVAVTEKTVLVE